MMREIKPVKPMTKQTGNIVTARIVPIFLLAILGYASYVVTKHVCIDYLLSPPFSLPTLVRRRTGAAIAVLTIYYILLLLLLTCLGRLIQTILTNPGLVPRGEQYYLEKERTKSKSSDQTERHEYNKESRLSDSSHDHPGYTPRHLRRSRQRDAKSNHHIQAENFWQKDVFVCGWDGRPPFCSTCYNYKPDRAHHCSELGRCVIKMDHFCPWVGGIVSETSFKYFIQFTFWAALYCLNTLIVMAYFFARRRQEESGFINVHWILILVLSALFFLFTAGMCGSSLQFAFINSTTIENFNRKTKVWYLAILVPRPVLEKYHAERRTDLRLISYPRPPEERFEVMRQNGAVVNDSQISVAREDWNTTRNPGPNVNRDGSGNNDRNVNVDGTTQPDLPNDTGTPYDPQSTALFPPHPAVARSTPPSSRGNTASTAHTQPQRSQVEPRTFAILESLPGANPFDLGAMGNFKQVMGTNVFDWLFPLRASPLTDHSDPESFYQLGPEVDRIRAAAGITVEGDKNRHDRPTTIEPEVKKHQHQHGDDGNDPRRKRRRSSHRHQHRNHDGGEEVTELAQGNNTNHNVPRGV